ncbi:class II fructose-bisphosphate aldolase [Methylococcus capsulatus]|uniref:class II fructose-bisphosphate aldolase n=1 Tax=Methylococcus capsulatus TaxID=414 RepID=UPI003F9EFAA8
MINDYGGDIGQTYGVPVEEIVEGIRHGVRKVNIDTDLRIASYGAMRRFMVEDRKNFDPRKLYKAAQTAMTAICRARYGRPSAPPARLPRSSPCAWRT